MYNITNEGILNMWVDKNVQGTGAMTATKDYGVAALNVLNLVVFLPHNILGSFLV